MCACVPRPERVMKSCQEWQLTYGTIHPNHGFQGAQRHTSLLALPVYHQGGWDPRFSCSSNKLRPELKPDQHTSHCDCHCPACHNIIAHHAVTDHPAFSHALICLCECMSTAAHVCMMHVGSAVCCLSRPHIMCNLFSGMFTYACQHLKRMRGGLKSHAP